MSNLRSLVLFVIPRSDESQDHDEDIDDQAICVARIQGDSLSNTITWPTARGYYDITGLAPNETGTGVTPDAVTELKYTYILVLASTCYTRMLRIQTIAHSKAYNQGLRMRFGSSSSRSGFKG
jgi:hypothetical protein